MKNKGVGVILLAVCVALFFVARHFFPGFSTILLVIFGIIFCLILLVTFRRPKNKRVDAVKPNSTMIVSQARGKLVELRRLMLKLKNQQIRKSGEEICGLIDKILQALREQPENISHARQFFNYYLPTLNKILHKYARVEESGMSSAELTESTISCLEDIKTALGKQYTNLFEDDILDLSVEMEALTLACKRDGLLSDEDFKIQSGNQNITLSL